MPRYARKLSETGIYHVMIRGIDKMNIFLDKNDKNRFLETLAKMKSEEEYYLYGYCLMDNHVHLLIKEGKDSIHRIMKRICVSYSYYFNHRHARVGHLFQDRYRSEGIETDQYILSCVRYIHNNPVKAGLVTVPQDYKWSSYQIYTGKTKDALGLMDCQFLLEIFSDDKSKAIHRFIEYSRQETEDRFIGYNEDESSVRMNGNQESEDIIVLDILNEYDMDVGDLRSCKDKETRNKILRDIKEKTNISLRELSKITGVSKDIIHRV